MQGDFLVKMRTAYNQFTKAEKKVADFILQNPREVLFMSITDLAEACQVGDTSVFRFCKSMELKGYQEFKMVLSLSLNENEKEHSRFTGNVGLNDTFHESWFLFFLHQIFLKHSYKLFFHMEVFLLLSYVLNLLY